MEQHHDIVRPHAHSHSGVLVVWDDVPARRRAAPGGGRRRPHRGRARRDHRRPLAAAAPRRPELVVRAGGGARGKDGDGKTPEESVWPHAKAFLAVEYVKVQRGAVVERDERMLESSYDPKRLTPAQRLLLVHSHWGAESSHHTLDTAFAEDDRPWIAADPQGLLAVLLLCRNAYTLLACTGP
jgi:hypothetical protein